MTKHQFIRVLPLTCIFISLLVNIQNSNQVLLSFRYQIFSILIITKHVRISSTTICSAKNHMLGWNTKPESIHYIKQYFISVCISLIPSLLYHVYIITVLTKHKSFVFQDKSAHRSGMCWSTVKISIFSKTLVTEEISCCTCTVDFR